MKAVVVGAGFGGLSAAALLARDGFDVTVLEKNAQPGGRARVLREEGFSFDMGPSWYLMPDVFERFFAEFGKSPEDFYKLIRIDPSYRIFFADGTMTDVSASLEDNLALFDSFEANGGEKLREYLERAERHYNLAMDELIYREYGSILDVLSGRLVLEGFRMPLFGNIEGFVSKTFSSEKSKRILEYSIGFIGGSPRNTPALYYIMNHVDFKLGVWYPDEGGIGRVVDAIHGLAVEHGARFEFDTPVRKLEVKGKKVRRVVTGEGVYEPDFVVVNADYPHSELELLDEPHRTYDERYWEGKEIGGPGAPQPVPGGGLGHGFRTPLRPEEGRVARVALVLRQRHLEDGLDGLPGGRGDPVRPCPPGGWARGYTRVTGEVLQQGHGAPGGPRRGADNGPRGREEDLLRRRLQAGLQRLQGNRPRPHPHPEADRPLPPLPPQQEGGQPLLHGPLHPPRHRDADGDHLLPDTLQDPDREVHEVGERV
jgi:hypothetical protein